MKLSQALFFLTALALTHNALSVTDADLYRYALDKKRVEAGKSQYMAACFACHGMELEGGTGFNLVDSEWVHGARPSDILNSIRKGFPDKGMMAFDAVHSQAELESLVAFILSRQLGPRNVVYRTYATPERLPQGFFPDLSLLRVNRAGTFKNDIIHLGRAKRSKEGIVVEGVLWVPEGDQSYLYANKLFERDIFQVKLNDIFQLPEQVNRETLQFALPPGRHSFSFAYFNNGSGRVPRLFIKTGESLVPISRDAKQFLSASSFKLIAEQQAVVARKKINGLPEKTIAVGLPEKINFGVNADTCSIVGIWSGDLLNIGPNIAGRGKKGSEPLGQFWFQDKLGIHLREQGRNPDCSYKKYRRGPQPRFYFNSGSVNWTLSAQAASGDRLSVILDIDNPDARALELLFPEGLLISMNGQLLREPRAKLPPSEKRIQLELKPGEASKQ